MVSFHSYSSGTFSDGRHRDEDKVFRPSQHHDAGCGIQLKGQQVLRHGRTSWIFQNCKIKFLTILDGQNKLGQN